MEQVVERLKEKFTKDYTSKFDIDLKFGEEAEYSLAHILSLGKIEVKTERDIWKTTGNIAIEIRYKGQPSGISTTKSSVWIHLLSYKGVIEGGFIMKVDQLRGKIKKLQKSGNLKMVMGGDFNKSQMVLLPIKELFI